MIASDCFAMTFSQPVKIGRIGWFRGEFFCLNSFYEEGDYYTQYDKDDKKTYGRKGVVGFGNNSNALYVHYNSYEAKKNRDGKVYLGGKNLSNTIPLDVQNEFIYQIDSNIGLTIYAIRFFYGPDSEFTIIGKKNDGTFVKYIDTREISKKYFGIDSKRGASSIFYNTPNSQDNTLVISYSDGRNVRTPIGEFRFKWDDDAQWFSVEHIVY